MLRPSGINLMCCLFNFLKLRNSPLSIINFFSNFEDIVLDFSSGYFSGEISAADFSVADFSVANISAVEISAVDAFAANISVTIISVVDI